MKHIHQWYCKSCRTVKSRDDFPPHIDANTLCRVCQQGRGVSRPSGSLSMTAFRRVYARRWSINRKHGADNRE